MRSFPSPPLSRRLRRSVVTLTSFATVALLVAPIVLTVVASFTASWTGALPSSFVTFENWRAVLGFADTIGPQHSMGQSPLFRLPLGGETLTVLAPAGLTFSIGLALDGVLINLVAGAPIACAVVCYELPGREWVNAVSVLPLVPGVILGIAFLRAYPDLSTTSFGLTAGYFPLKAPFMVMAVQSGFESMPLRQLEEPARSLDASWPRVFLTVIVPNARPDIVSGTITYWTLAAVEFNFSYIVWANGTQPLVLSLQRHISSSSFTKAAAAVSMFFFTTVAVTLLLQRVGHHGFDIRGS